MQEIDIGDLAMKVGVSTATIRFYESKGLIKPLGRKGLRRQYPQNTIQIIILIKLLKNSGLSLKEIKEIFILDRKIDVNRSLIDAKSNQIEEKISNLKNLLMILQHIKYCPYAEHVSCPEFLKMLNEYNDKS